MWGTFLCASYVTCLHVFSMLGGLTVIGLTAWLIIEKFQFGIFTEEDWIIWIPLAVGIFITLLGCVAACKSNPANFNINMILACIQGILGLAIGCLGALAMITVVYMAETSETSAPNLAGGIGDYRQFLSDYSLGLYGSCCRPNNLPDGFDTKCSTDNSTSLDAVCYWTKANRNSGMYNVSSTACDDVNDLDLCTLSSDWKDFQSGLADWFHDYAWPAGIAFVAYGGALLLAVIGSCVLAAKHAQAAEEEAGEEEEAPEDDDGNKMKLQMQAFV
mmetsp:Transcript_21371/g.41904  ORF Transcript_21371/g.41904 Transcript_21371/m.41904 type:complete len:274 (-) Transcript_21371:200-1021(-)|eukprot:CAMPEP_0171490222 /NCGR_PEP_ID=MMETSP0958-20121227/3186_1 /TAXON_ID=87120 /ORGANISM="Aurantiochytrium limacinum, Strain ATCCMYA-1381" /LENGTH=273 /DNA_ID=CAMNT_0012023509 /DNA_START=961 /DNA_END=1782 /DNA_ORIENTATION=-